MRVEGRYPAKKKREEKLVKEEQVGEGAKTFPFTFCKHIFSVMFLCKRGKRDDSVCVDKKGTGD